MNDNEQTRLAVEALKAAGCGVLAIHVQSRIEALEKDAARWKYAANDRVSGRGFDIVVCRATWGQRPVYEVLCGDMADECVDTAMQADKGE